MDETTLKYSALVQEALSYKQDSPIYRPTYYKINRNPSLPSYDFTVKKDRKTLWTLFAILGTVFFLTTLVLACVFVFKVYPVWGSPDQKVLIYDKNVPVAFLTGYPESGTDLLRHVLNTYPDIRCGVDDRTLPDFLQKQNEVEQIQIGSAVILDKEESVPNYAASFAYVMETLVSQSQPSKSLCSEVPYVLKWSYFLNRLLPNAKYILVIRDPRAVALSLAEKQDQQSNYTFIYDIVRDWNEEVDSMLNNCRALGPLECYPIYFEEMAIRPDKIVPALEAFLNLEIGSSNLKMRVKEHFAEVDLDSWRENDVVRQIDHSNAVNSTLLYKLGYGGRGKISYLKLQSEDLL